MGGVLGGAALPEVLLRAAAPPLGAWRWGALEVDLDPRLGGRLADPLNGRTLTVRLPLGVGGLKELGDSRPRMFTDLRRAGAGHLQAEVQPSHVVRLPRTSQRPGAPEAFATLIIVGGELTLVDQPALGAALETIPFQDRRLCKPISGRLRKLIVEESRDPPAKCATRHRVGPERVLRECLQQYGVFRPLGNENPVCTAALGNISQESVASECHTSVEIPIIDPDGTPHVVGTIAPEGVVSDD